MTKTWETSWRLASVTTSDKGTPLPSTRIWRLLPFFPRSVGFLMHLVEQFASLHFEFLNFGEQLLNRDFKAIRKAVIAVKAHHVSTEEFQI
jgi:hypothetical protein